jgi:hypothetical protein
VSFILKANIYINAQFEGIHTAPAQLIFHQKQQKAANRFQNFIFIAERTYKTYGAVK